MAEPFNPPHLGRGSRACWIVDKVLAKALEACLPPLRWANLCRQPIPNARELLEKCPKKSSWQPKRMKNYKKLVQVTNFTLKVLPTCPPSIHLELHR